MKGQRGREKVRGGEEGGREREREREMAYQCQGEYSCLHILQCLSNSYFLCGYTSIKLVLFLKATPFMYIITHRY